MLTCVMNNNNDSSKYHYGHPDNYYKKECHELLNTAAHCLYSNRQVDLWLSICSILIAAAKV